MRKKVSKIVVFPVPFVARAFWRCVSLFLPQRTAAKVLLIGGEDFSSSAKQPDELGEVFHFFEFNF